MGIYLTSGIDYLGITESTIFEMHLDFLIKRDLFNIFMEIREGEFNCNWKTGLEYPFRKMGLEYPHGWQIILTKEDFYFDNFEKWG